MADVRTLEPTRLQRGRNDLDFWMGLIVVVFAVGALVLTRDPVALVPVVFGGLVVSRRPEARVEDDGIVLRGYVRTRRFAWADISSVEIERRWVGFRSLKIMTTDGEIHRAESVGSWSRNSENEAERFAALARSRAAGPPVAPRPIFDALRHRSGVVYWAIVVCCAILGVFIVAAVVVTVT